MVSLRARYRQYIARLLALAGFGHATERARAVLALEVALARTQASPEASARDLNADSLWNRADFARRAPGMDWSAFFDAAGLAGRGRSACGSRARSAGWRPWSRPPAHRLEGLSPFHLVHDNVDLLPRGFAEAGEALRQAEAGGRVAPPDRAQRAIEATQAALGEAVGRLYAERYFAPAQRPGFQVIVANVIAAFRKRVEAASWMSAETRATALAKLDAVYFGIGYPERWQDYSDLVVKADDPVGNLRRVRAWDYRRALARLGRPVEPTEWWLPPPGRRRS